VIANSFANTSQLGQYNIVSLQVMRGLAAVAVVFYHVYIILMSPEYGEHVVFQQLARHGFLGVGFFFVLSGFIIFMAHARDIGRPSTVPTYVYKRVARVYPAYWIYLTAFICAAGAGIGYPDFSWDIGNLTSSYLLMAFVEEMTLPLKVAWTLVYEIRFYAIFILLLIFGTPFLWAFVVWGGAVVVAFLILGTNVPDVIALWNLYFLAGMLGLLALDRVPAKLGGWIFLTGVALFVVYGFVGSDILRIRHLEDNRPELHFLLVPAFLALILGGVLIERAYNIRFPSVLTLLGDASYSIYLVHSAAISAIVLVSRKLGLIESMGLELFFVFAFIAATFVGILAYFIVEKPLIRLSKRLLRRTTAA